MIFSKTINDFLCLKILEEIMLYVSKFWSFASPLFFPISPSTETSVSILYCAPVRCSKMQTIPLFLFISKTSCIRLKRNDVQRVRFVPFLLLLPPVIFLPAHLSLLLFLLLSPHKKMLLPASCKWTARSRDEKEEDWGETRIAAAHCQRYRNSDPHSSHSNSALFSGQRRSWWPSAAS